jgi:Flp pilus assembly protein TadD
MATAEMRLGRVEDAEAGIRRAIELFERAEDLHAVVIGLGNLGELAALRGDFEQAVTEHRRGLEAARRHADLELEGWELSNLATALHHTGEWRQALPLMVDGLMKLHEADDVPSLLEALTTSGALLYAAGDMEGAALSSALGPRLAASFQLTLQVSEFAPYLADV